MNGEALVSKYVRIARDMYVLENDVGGSLDLLESPFRKPQVLDSWTPLEIALFIGGITRFGRNWESIKSLLPNKSAPEMASFYYSVWKGSKPYFAWKRIRKQRGLE